MSYNQKALKLDVNNKPVPQLYNPGIDDFEALQGRGGASAIVAGRFWQVGAGATTTSIPMLTSSGLAVALSSANQSRLVGSTLEIIINSTMCEANVTAVSTSGTLTLDSPLPSAPAQGTTFLLVPPANTQLTGSNTTFFANIAPQSSDKGVTIPFTTHKLMVKNDGNDAIWFTLDGKASTGVAHPYTDGTWTYSGTWAATTVSGINGLAGTNVNSTTTASSTATFKPNASLYEMIVQFAEGTYAGTVNVQLSQDGGTTWVNPSTIPGVSRFDGATGTSLDSYTTATANPNTTVNVAYNLPYPSNQWALQLTFSSGHIYLTGGIAVGTDIFIVKPSESLELDAATAQFNFSSPTSTTGRLYAQ